VGGSSRDHSLTVTIGDRTRVCTGATGPSSVATVKANALPVPTQPCAGRLPQAPERRAVAGSKLLLQRPLPPRSRWSRRAARPDPGQASPERRGSKIPATEEA
jgi:hypothetical protein